MPTSEYRNNEHFDLYDSYYVGAIKSPHRRYKLRLELLDYYETVIGEITQDLSLSNQGQLSINYEQLTHRSISLTMINIQKKYIPSPNNPFWLNRKFKLWIGIVGNGSKWGFGADKTIEPDIYWWSCGVFFTQSATSDRNTVTINGIDKGGAIDGTLMTGMTETQRIVKVGTSITDLVKDTLMITNSPFMGGQPIDPVPPIIDMSYNKVLTESELTLDANNYLGSLLISVANGYGSDIYYNTNGHLTLAVKADSSRVEGYNYMAHQWDFYDSGSEYSATNFEYSFGGVNAVTVYTNVTETDLKNVSYTAYNNNPISPMRIALVGERRLEQQEVVYTDTTTEGMLRKCKDYAEYLLLKQSLIGMTVTFNCPLIPHIDVNRTIGITDAAHDINQETFVVQSVSMNLGAGEMTITASNVTWLPNDKVMGGRGEINEQTA